MARKKLFLFFYIQFFLLGLGGSIFGPLIPILADGFKVNLDTIGSTLSLSAFGLLLASLFSGILSEISGKRNIFTLGSILFTASFLGLYFSSHFIYFTLSYIVFGISWGMVAVNSTSIISDAFHLNRSKIIIRLNTGFLLGSFFAPILVSGILFLNINWRYLFLSVALINVLLFILILSIKLEGLNNKKHKENLVSLFTTNRKLLSNLIIILCGIINFLHFGLGFTFGAWFTAYFKNLNVPVTIGSLILSLYLLTFGIGMFVKSSLLAKFNGKKIMQFSSILAFVFLFISFFLDLVTLKIIFIILFSFSFSGIAATSLSMGIKQSPRNSGSIISIINSFGFTGVIIFQYTAGYLSENFSVDSVIYIGLAALFLLAVFTSILSSCHKFDRKLS